MSLGNLITALEAADPRLVLPDGFHHPHSYRGYYDELAFEPAQNVTVADMLADARSALGATYQGWKGGDYAMSEHTTCWLAEQGLSFGDMLGPLLVKLMLAAGYIPSEPEPDPDPADPRQIAVRLMNDAAHDLYSSKVREAIEEAIPGISSIDRASLIETIHELAETADITIGWAAGVAS